MWASVSWWLEVLESEWQADSVAAREFQSYYGNDLELVNERRACYARTLRHFRTCFGTDRRVAIVRCPGRVNIMGRHIDWQGGRCNLVAIDREIVVALSPREDDQIEIRNVRADLFEDASVSLKEFEEYGGRREWLRQLNDPKHQARLLSTAGHWRLYVEGALARLQLALQHDKLLGFDAAVNGDIPIAAGLSSSAALVMATLEALVVRNGLNIPPETLVQLCGEAEWFVGTRGGCADPAAMKFSRPENVCHVSFHEFELIDYVRFPSTHRLLICNSFVEAKKAVGAKAVFNSRVASYRIGIELLRSWFPDVAAELNFVRDLRPETLNVPLLRIYELLSVLPDALTGREAHRLFGEDPDVWEKLRPHLENRYEDVFPVRGVMVFGATECARARVAWECLKRQDMELFGSLMKISHEGERQYRVQDDLTADPVGSAVSDEWFLEVMSAITSGDPARAEAAQLHWQPGAYLCSTLEVDALVDIACRTPGILGAQIAGAGMGGCAMVLARREAVPELVDRLVRLFYTKKGLPSGINVCGFVGGSGMALTECGECVSRGAINVPTCSGGTRFFGAQEHE